jgi:hypothetical protein
MLHRDRPSIRLTVDERRQFDELAARLRYELDGASFDTPGPRRVRLRTRATELRGRTVRRMIAAAGTWWTGPLVLTLGLLALGPMIFSWVTVATPALIVLPATLVTAGQVLTTLRFVKHRRRHAKRIRSPTTRDGHRVTRNQRRAR